MIFKKINQKDFSKEIRDIYEESFPSDERRDLESQIKLLDNKRYDFKAIYENNSLIGLIACWDLEDFLFIEHFAIKKELRGKGIGTNLLKQYINKKRVVLEVEQSKSELNNRRIKFYERLGFYLNYYDYIQPSYGKNKKPVPMYLMTFPDKLDNIGFLSLKKNIYKIVYGKLIK